MNPIIKWAGGKRWLVPVVKELVRDIRFNRIVEPFAGGAAISLGLESNFVVLNDTNIDLIDMYKSVRALPGELSSVIEFLRTLPNTKDTYYHIRRQFNEFKPVPSSSARFIYLNKAGYNGLVRYNRSGEFNTPFGRYKTVALPTYDEIMAFRAVIRNWVFYNTNYHEFITNMVAPGDLVYIDPPYWGQFNGYGPSKFTEADHVALAHIIRDVILPRGAHVIVSNALTPETENLLGFLNLGDLTRQQNVSSNAATRGRVVEMLATSF